jgi:hypothetical protein
MEKVQRLDGGGQYKFIDSIEVLNGSKSRKWVEGLKRILRK